MNSIAAIEVGCHDERVSDVPRGFDSASLAVRGMRALRAWRRREVIDCVAAISIGVLMAAGWALAGPNDSGGGARRLLLERELTQLSPSLTELARLSRAGESTRASVAAAAARARPYMELRTLLETLGREAHAGVTVSRLRQTQEGFELQVHAVDSAACASWVARLARIPGWQSADIAGLRLAAARGGGQSGRAVEASVRLPLRAMASAPLPRRTPVGRDDRGDRSDR
jgi:Tfp pilus assembly protein PilN